VSSQQSPVSSAQLSDEEIIVRVRQGETSLYEVLMRRHNQRLYRTVRAILGSDDAEDVIQEAYLQAYRRLNQFRGDSAFLTWLTRIAIRRALAHKRRLQKKQEQIQTEQVMARQADGNVAGPDRQAFNLELRQILESAIDRMPTRYRSVLMLRDVEGLSTAETAECLRMTPEAAKIALHRARRRLRGLITEQVGGQEQLFPFDASRCNTVVEGVLRQILPG
jgi:RNA polymerase sigma-70 factor, ECF subfamily